MALRHKFKQCRQPLCSVQAIADARVKFGRPGVSGRKRKTTGDDRGSLPPADHLAKKGTAQGENINIIRGACSV